MKRFAITALMSGVALAAAAPASAATNVSQCQSSTATPTTCNIAFADGLAGTFGNSMVLVRPFTDIYNFDISAAGLLGFTLSSVASSATSDVSFSLVRLDGPGGTSTTVTPSSTGTVEFYTLANIAAVAGQYTLSLAGTVAGTPPMAAYSGTISFAPTPTAAVPEPAAWGMMMLGFGLVGGALRRRKTSVAFA